MSERLTDDERRVLVAGERSGTLEPAAAAEIAFLADVLADPSTWAEPDPALEDRVLAAVAEAGTTRSDPTTARRHVAETPTRPTARRGSRVLAASVAAAASIAIVVGALSSLGDGSGADFSARLTATDLAPGARASVSVTHNDAGFRIALDAHGLRRLPSGAYYQAWLRNAHGGLVSIGTFSGSDGAIVLWSGVSPQEYKGITITIEPDDDDPASSGRRVLAGELRA
ncbi:MAG: anti-sigma factor [Acidimicrobiia bacterium]